MPDFKKAIKNGIVDGFTMNPFHSATDNSSIRGNLSHCDNKFVYVKIVEGIDELSSKLMNNCHFYNLNFHINRLSFQLQHNALAYMKSHELFPILINNPRYFIESDNHPTLDLNDYKFRFAIRFYHSNFAIQFFLNNFR